MTTEYFNGAYMPVSGSVVVYNYQAPGSTTTTMLPPGHQWARVMTQNLYHYICMDCHFDFPFPMYNKDGTFLSPDRDSSHKWIVIDDWRQKYYNGSECQQCGMTKAVDCNGLAWSFSEDLSCDEKIIKEIVE
jgi:hypothetical protein